MGLAAIITSFVIILPAELPDKTVIACLVLGSRYRPAYVFAGAAAAFAIQVALAVTAGGLLSLLPHQVTEIIVAVLFVVGAVILLRQKQAQRRERRVRGAAPAPPVVPARRADQLRGRVRGRVR